MLLLLAQQASSDQQTFFILALVAVLVVVLFAAGVVGAVFGRLYRGRIEHERMLAVGQATARILHQIKNPMQTVMLQAELLREPAIADDPAAREEATRAILSETERMSALLSELGLWASGGRRAFELQPTSLTGLLEPIVHAEVARPSPVTVRLELPPGAAIVMADPYYLRQALENLVRNAREAVADQTGGFVVVTLERDGRTATVRVEDNGPGIPRERLGEIFRPFVSGKSSGMGLGLPICKEIIDGHSGRLEVRSQPGAGAEFRVFLPLYEHRESTSKGGRPD